MLPNGAILRAVYAEIVPAAPPGRPCCRLLHRRRGRAPAPWRRRPAAAGLLARRRAGLGRHRRRRRRHAHLHGRRHARRRFAAARPLFEVMGARAVHCGGAGAGQAAKICNNMILGVTMIAVCEAFALADKLGLDRAGALRRGLDLVRLLLVGQRLLPRPGRRADLAGRQRLPPGLRRRADAEGPDPGPERRRGGRRGHPARRRGRRDFRALPGRGRPRPGFFRVTSVA